MLKVQLMETRSQWLKIESDISQYTKRMGQNLSEFSRGKKASAKVSRNETSVRKDIRQSKSFARIFKHSVGVCVNTHGGREGRRGKEEMNVCPQFFYPVMLSSLMYSLHLPQLLLVGVQWKEAVAPPVHSMMMMTSVEQLIIHLLDPFVESKF